MSGPRLKGYKPPRFCRAAPDAARSTLRGRFPAPHYLRALEASMAEAIELKAWARGRSGKGGARAERREGRVPGTLYGDKKDPRDHLGRLSRHQPPAPYRPFPEHHLRARRRRQEDAGDPARGAARSGARLSHPCRFPAARQGRAGHGRGAGALPERGGLARPEARRRAQHRAPRDPGALPRPTPSPTISIST